MAEVNGERAARKLKSRLAAVAMRRLGLIYVSTDVLTIRRQRKGDGWTFISQDGRTIRDEIARARLKTPRGAAGLRGRALRRRSARAHPGNRSRCGRAPAIPLSSGLGKGARTSQGEAPAAAGRSAAAHPPRGEQASRHRRADARVRALGCHRAHLLQRDPRGRRELREGERHARRRDAAQVERCGEWRDHRAEIPRQGRQDRRQGVSLPARRGRDQCAASAAGKAAVPVSRRGRHRASSPRAM